MRATPTASTHTLGTELERNRLESRVSRTTFAIAALRQRASEYRRELGSPPRQLRQVIADFEAQIEEMNARLRDLAREPASTQVQQRRGTHENRH
jgi:chromosome segregation ATPase